MRKYLRTDIETFDDYLKLIEVKLRPWQKRAAKAFFREMKGQGNRPSGKTFLLNTITDFITEYGNTCKEGK